MQTTAKTSSSWQVILAFATVYLVWGSTYFFIQLAIADFPPFLMGALRFLIAGMLLFGWCLYKKETLWRWHLLKVAAITGILLLFIGNGAIIWAEKTIASSLVAIFVSSAPLWFVLLDQPKWQQNLSSKKVVSGLLIGFAGVLLLFSHQLKALFTGQASPEIAGLGVLLLGSISWAGGSLFSKYRSVGTPLANSTWQMLVGGIVFLLVSLSGGEWQNFHFSTVHSTSWFALFYLIIFGSIAAYSAYVWLLQVRPATQVSTYAYVNPVVAVLLGVLFAGEQLGLLQVAGLAVILLSVLLINRAKK